jgi:hypothetical protein
MDADLIQLLDTGFAYCLAVARDNDGLIGTLFVAGLAGSISHCTAMCGPFVLTQVASRMPTDPGAVGELQRLGKGALIPYQLGRLTTYSALGAIAGAALSQIGGGETGLYNYLAAALLVIAGLAFLAQAWRQAIPALSFGAGAPGIGALAAPEWLSAVTAKLLINPRRLQGYALGVMLGFLPCGLLYGALAAAAGAGSAGGALAMAAFAVGTMPALIGVGYLGDIFRRTAHDLMGLIVRILLTLNAGVLGYMAWRLIA